MEAITIPDNSTPQSVLNASRKTIKPDGIVFKSLELINTVANKNSFQAKNAFKITVVTTTGMDKGR